MAHAALVVGGQQASTLASLRRLQTSLSESHYATCLHVGRGDLSAAEAVQAAALLVSKGVPAEKAESRVADLAKKVGAAAVAQALKASNPGQNLKAAASRPGCSFRIILPEELEMRIRAKGADEHGAAVPNGGCKKRRQAAAKKPELRDPAALQLADGTFCAEDGQTMHQISFEEVTLQAHGLAFCSAEQAIPFLQGAALSTEPLCLTTVTELPSELKACRQHEVIRFPAVYKPTGEAMLLTGSLINLGDVPVALAQGTIAEPSSLNTCVCRVSLFRDELPNEWEKIVAGPVRWLIQNTPCLRVCSGKDCGIDCPAFHPAVDERVDQMLLDIWSRTFQSHEGKKAEASSADVYSVMLRVPSSAIDQLQAVQLVGTYFEPRLALGRGYLTTALFGFQGPTRIGCDTW